MKKKQCERDFQTQPKKPIVIRKPSWLLEKDQQDTVNPPREY